MSTFTAIVVSHRNPDGLRAMLGNLIYQTRKPDEIVVFVSDTTAAEFAQLADDFGGHATFVRVNDRNDWGHDKRAAGIDAATGDYLGFFNDDDSYDDDYLEVMLTRAEEEGADVVWCAWNENPLPSLRLGSSTAGNFIVRTDLARRCGYVARQYEADGVFIDAISATADRAVFVPALLYWHNEQP